MLNKKNLFLVWILLMVVSVAFAQDGSKAKDKADKAKKEVKKKEKKAKDKAKKTKDKTKDKVKGEKADKSDEDGDDYPYPAVRDKEYKDFVKEKHHDQQDEFLANKYNYPAPPKHKTEVGIHAGLLMISGDVKAKPGFGWGLHLRRAWGYVFSTRLSFMMGRTTGRNWQGTQGWARNGTGLAGPDGFAPNFALAGGARYDELNNSINDFNHTPDYRGLNNDIVFYNYQTKIRDLVLEGIVNLNNIKFHKRQNKGTFYGIFGVGGTIYQARMDQLNSEGREYDYGQVTEDWSEFDSRRDRIDDLENIWDGEYESFAERHFDDFELIDDWGYKTTFHVGLGYGFKLGRVVNLALESKVAYMDDDLLDGQRWDEWSGNTRNFDTYVYTQARLNFNLGAKNSVEPLWWMNPIDYTYQELNKKPCCEELSGDDLEFSDKDKDGVPDIWDEEPDSRPDCPVDTRGRMLDSDRDGVLDCDDLQPHTPYEHIGKVDKDGVYIDNCCEELDKRLTALEQLGLQNSKCADPMLPSVLFDLNRYGVKEAFKPQLAEVANFLRNCPTTKLCVIGHTDNRSSDPYNNVLSYKRAQEVVNILTSEYGVPRSQLVIQYRGEGAPVVPGLSDSASSKGIDGNHALNRRVDFKVCESSDMPRPAGPDAGRR